VLAYDHLHLLQRQRGLVAPTLDGPATDAQTALESTLNKTSQSADERLKSFAKVFIEFCLMNRNMYNIFFMARGSRVDEEQPALEIQSIRNQMFGLLRQAIQACLDAKYSDELVLAYARIFFYTLHGILATYKGSEEELTALMERLAPTFELAVDVMIAGFNTNAKRGSDIA
jgi:hypothetical protein